MTFPRPDTAVEVFPAADSGLARFPYADTGVEPFPPTPTPTILAVVALTMSPAASVSELPWRDAVTLLTMTPAATGSAVVEIEAVTVLAMSPELSPVHEMTADAGLAMAPAAVVAPSMTVAASTALTLSPGIQGTPVAVVTADAITTLSVSATVAVAGIITAPAPLTMTPAATPTAQVSTSAATALTLTPSNVLQVITFRPSGMVRNTTVTAYFGTSMGQILGWNADTTNYPGSSVVSSDLIAQTAATNGTIQVSVECQNTAFSGRSVYMQIRINGGTPIESAELPIGSNTTAVLAWSAAGLTIPAGATIRLEARCPNSNQVRSTGNTASYVRLIQP
ncbi:hypothetical protein [Nocardia sp. NPDC003963]